MKNRPLVGFCVLVVGLLLCASGLLMRFTPSLYQATVQIEIEPDNVADIPGSDGAIYQPYFMETQLKMIQGDIVLNDVVEALNLDTAWGKQTDESIKLLRQRIGIDTERNTKVVSIHIWDEKPDEAAKIANAIAQAYINYRLELHQREMKGGMAVLYNDYSNEEVQIQLMQSNVDRLRFQYKIHDTAPDSIQPLPAVEQMQHLNERLIEGKAMYIRLQNQYSEFQTTQATNPAALADVLLTVSPDDTLSNLMSQLHERERDLAVETNQFAAQSPELASTRAMIEKNRQQIADHVNGMMLGLKVNVEAQKAQVDAIQKEIQIVKDDATREAPYWQAKRALQDKKELHQLLRDRIENIKADASVPQTTLVTIVAPAVPPLSPSRPNRYAGAGLLVCGLILTAFGLKSLRSGLKSAQ